MRRTLALTLLLVVVPLTPAPTRADIVHIRPNAANVKSWLGSWRTNFGVLNISDVFYTGTNWGLSGVWTGPRGTKRFEAAIDSRDYQAFQGCWKPPPDPADSCGRILVFRTGHRINGGFWADCRNNCVGHHAWKGEQTTGYFTLGFRFTQRGYPEGQRTIPTQTGGAGSVLFKTRPHIKSKGTLLTGATVFHIDHTPAGDLNLRAELTNGRVLFLENRRRVGLALTGHVTSSDDPRCKPPAPVSLQAIQGRGGVPDHLRLAVAGCGSQSWTSANPSRVNVNIDPARETP